MFQQAALRSVKKCSDNNQTNKKRIFNDSNNVHTVVKI